MGRPMEGVAPRLPQQVNQIIDEAFGTIKGGDVDPRSALSDAQRRAISYLMEARGE